MTANVDDLGPKRWMKSELHREWAMRIGRFLLVCAAVALAYVVGSWLSS